MSKKKAAVGAMSTQNEPALTPPASQPKKPAKGKKSR